jgi:hypothetical protein
MMVDYVVVNVVSGGRDCDHGSINNLMEFTAREQEIEAGNILNSFFSHFFLFLFFSDVFIFLTIFS